MSRHFQLGESPSRGLLRDCENRWMVCSSSYIPVAGEDAALAGHVLQLGPALGAQPQRRPHTQPQRGAAHLGAELLPAVESGHVWSCQRDFEKFHSACSMSQLSLLKGLKGCRAICQRSLNKAARSKIREIRVQL